MDELQSRNSSVQDTGPKAKPMTPADKSIAVSIALVADLVIEIIPSPWGQILDVITGLLLFWKLGATWILLPAFIIEMVPGAGCFPTWLAATSWICMNSEKK